MSRKPPPRDPAAPKRNMSAYLLYQNAMRETFKLQNPGMTFGQNSKYTSAMYAELSPHEKEEWVQKAEEDKARYLQELNHYVPAPGYDLKGDLIEVLAPSGGWVSKALKNLHKDPNAPKKNMSAYLLYQNFMRNQFKVENPGMTFGQLSKYTSHMYRSLTPEEKQQWDQHAAQDKARYESEIANYTPPEGYDNTGTLKASKQSGSRKYSKKEKDPNAPKRARGSFVFFTFDVRPQILKENPGINFTQLGNVMGERWRALTPEEKKHYEDMASNDKKRFSEEMQEYTANKNNTMTLVEVKPEQNPSSASSSMYGAPPEAEHNSTHYPQQFYQGYPSNYDPNTAHRQYAEYFTQQAYTQQRFNELATERHHFA